jgi:hypothetical protein
MNRPDAVALSAETGKYIEGELRAPRELSDADLEAELLLVRKYREAAYIRSNGSTAGSIVVVLQRLDRRLEDLQAESDRRDGNAGRQLATQNFAIDKRTHHVTVWTLWVAVAALVVAALSLWVQLKQAPSVAPVAAPLTLGLTPTTSDAGQ